MEVGLFIPCYVNQFYPQIGIATLNILKKTGVNLHYPENQTCCGQPLANSGQETDAIPVYNHFVNIFSTYDYVVVPSASCAYHVRKHYDIIEQTEEVVRIRKITLDLTEFLHDVIGMENIEAKFPHKVGLHQSCHGLRGLRLAQSSERVLPHFSKWENLLQKVDGLELVKLEFPDECCGFGGTFAVQEAEVSTKMGSDKIRDLIKNEVEYVTSGDMSCLMHLDGLIKREKLPLKTIHLAEILNSKL
ncbi:MAG: (Fe-S)-binding protein [Bacteroidetes bacterium]|nr:(Fe-S)-binding protein [Bacteroidota bacterium]